jgi:hypothetical protein
VYRLEHSIICNLYVSCDEVSGTERELLPAASLGIFIAARSRAKRVLTRHARDFHSLIHFNLRIEKLCAQITRGVFAGSASAAAAIPEQAESLCPSRTERNVAVAARWPPGLLFGFTNGRESHKRVCLTIAIRRLTAAIRLTSAAEVKQRLPESASPASSGASPAISQVEWSRGTHGMILRKHLCIVSFWLSAIFCRLGKDRPPHFPQAKVRRNYRKFLG